MANLQETGVWEAGIYQLETSDPVMGGAGGISNRAPRQLANRTLWLKNELASAVQSIGINKADKTTQVIAGNGLTGGGDLTANRTLALGTPGTITASSTNAVQAASHTHAIDAATTGKAGIVQLSSAINNPAENLAATPKAVMDALAAAMAGNLTLHGALGSKNLNDLIGQAHYGIYHQVANASATSDLNYPTQKAGTLLVLPSAYSGVQLYIPFDMSLIYIRNQAGTNGAMSAWRSIGEIEDVLTSSSAITALSAAKGKELNDSKADKATTINAGNGLTGGGTLAANRMLALGTPGTITASSTNSVQAASHTHAIDAATTGKAGIVQLSSAINSAAENLAATPRAVRDAVTAATNTGNNLQSGWTKLPNGFMLQWGVRNHNSWPGEIEVSVTFPVAFTSGCWCAFLAPISAGLGAIDADAVVKQNTLTQTGMTVITNNHGGQLVNLTEWRGFYWVALGA